MHLEIRIAAIVSAENLPDPGNARVLHFITLNAARTPKLEWI